MKRAKYFKTVAKKGSKKVTALHQTTVKNPKKALSNRYKKAGGKLISIRRVKYDTAKKILTKQVKKGRFKYRIKTSKTYSLVIK